MILLPGYLFTPVLTFIFKQDYNRLAFFFLISFILELIHRATHGNLNISRRKKEKKIRHAAKNTRDPSDLRRSVTSILVTV